MVICGGLRPPAQRTSDMTMLKEMVEQTSMLVAERKRDRVRDREKERKKGRFENETVRKIVVKIPMCKDSSNFKSIG